MRKDDDRENEDTTDPADDFTKVGDIVSWVLSELSELAESSDEITRLESRGDELCGEDQAELAELRDRRDQLLEDFGWTK